MRTDPQLLHNRRCAHHAEREAAARCPSCKAFYCRECITEHDGRFLCAGCLAKKVREETRARISWIPLRRCLQAAGGLALLTVFFLLVGRVLMSIPDHFHQATVWEKSWLDE